MAWYPLAEIGGLLTFGLVGLVFPAYTNPGMCLLVLRWPLTAFAFPLVQGLWVAALIVTGWAKAIVARRATTQVELAVP